MRHVGLVAAAFAAATALSSKHGKEFVNRNLQPIFLHADNGAQADGAVYDEYAVLRTSQPVKR